MPRLIRIRKNRLRTTFPNREMVVGCPLCQMNSVSTTQKTFGGISNKAIKIDRHVTTDSSEVAFSVFSSDEGSRLSWGFSNLSIDNFHEFSSFQGKLPSHNDLFSSLNPTYFNYIVLY